MQASGSARRPGGLYGNAIRIISMLDVTEEEIDEGIAALVAAIEKTG